MGNRKIRKGEVSGKQKSIAKKGKPNPKNLNFGFVRKVRDKSTLGNNSLKVRAAPSGQDFP
jgi:hypothetical protein